MPAARGSLARSWRLRSTMPAGPARPTLEAYPVDTAGQRITSANAFHGTLSMFESAGFDVVERRQWNASTQVRPIVRLAL